MIQELWFNCRQCQEIFLYSQVSRMALGCLQSPMQRVLWLFHCGLKAAKVQSWPLTQPHLVVRLGMSTTVPLVPSHSLMVCTRTYLPLLYPIYFQIHYHEICCEMFNCLVVILCLLCLCTQMCAWLSVDIGSKYGPFWIWPSTLIICQAVMIWMAINVKQSFSCENNLSY
jgi:hypothetical protein